MSLREQRQTMTVLREAPGGTVVAEAVVVSNDEPAARDTVEVPQPGNRAERRAMQRQQAQLRHRPAQ